MLSSFLKNIVLITCSFFLAGSSFGKEHEHQQHPNILFVIMDDVGVDQFGLFGYGGVDGPQTPVLKTIAENGVKFRNVWATPECSPSRVSMFTGRYPMRHNVMAAILPPDLAISQQSPFETATPKVLKVAGYKSALIGKSHFTNSPTNPRTPSTNPYGETAVAQLGWDYFQGWFDGGPNAIDTTAGGVVSADPTTGLGPYKCGYVSNKQVDPVNGADSGACYQPNGSCVNLSQNPGQTCLQSGGILVPNASCTVPLPSNVNFNQQNGYYVSQLVVNTGENTPAVISPVDDPVGRGYRTTLEANFAIDWINKQSISNPWMTTISFSSAHTPFQPAPSSLVYTKAITVGQDCSDGSVDSRLLMNQMIEAMDKELGRVLVETGIATKNIDGSISYDPHKSNTLIVIVGDNGSYASDVRLPFDPEHSKGTVYQTGVWVPLIVAGPMVNKPGRDVSSMVNIVDLFSLFGDVAGLNVRSYVPKTHALDAKPLMPYLTHSIQDQEPIRSTNFTQYGENTRATDFVNGTCVIQSANTCTTLFPGQKICEVDYGGTWYGEGTSQPIPSSYPNGFSSCCQVNQYLYSKSPSSVVAVLPDNSYAVRNKDYKLVQQTTTNYDPNNPTLGASCLTQTVDEFYKVNELPVTLVPPQSPALDRPTGNLANNLLSSGASSLTYVQNKNYQELQKELTHVIGSAQPCPGDANLDGLINSKDYLEQIKWIGITGGSSTWWDMNQDGLTNDIDISLLKTAVSPCKLPR